jgi:hypothetical protein
VATSGHLPFTATQGRASPEQPLGYLLAKTGETVWKAASAGQSEVGPYLVPARTYTAAPAAKAGLSQARDFPSACSPSAFFQEEDGWPDHAGDPSGKRSGHGGPLHDTHCLLANKSTVEQAIYGIR